jgi:hypothetical protein
MTAGIPTLASHAKYAIGSSRCGLVAKLEEATYQSYVRDALAYTAGEVRAVEQFVEISDSVGLRIPSTNPPLRAQDYLFQLNSGNPMSIPEEGCAWLTPSVDDTSGLAQHHGVPTRLLDFTRNPLVAAYFAARSEEAQTDDEAEQIAVWAVDASELEKQSRIRTMTCRRAENSFLHAQDGLFLWDTEATADYVAKGAWPTMDSVLRGLETTHGYEILRKVTLPVSEVPRLLRLLWRKRAALPHLMPSYDNIAKSLGTYLDHEAGPYDVSDDADC